MKENTYCPWCGRNMDKLENGKLDGHTWYRDDSDYIQNIERSRDFMKKQLERLEQMEQLCRDMWWDLQVHGHKVQTILNARYQKRMDALGLLEGEQQ